MKLTHFVGLSLGALTVASLPFAFAQTPGTQFRFTLVNENFTLKIQQTYDPKLSLEQVRANYEDGGLLAQVSDLIDRQEKKVNADGTFTLFTYASKSLYGITKRVTTVNTCSATASATQWTQTCQLALNQGDTGKYFYSGTTSINCSLTTQVTCQLRIDGHPKPINLLVYKRTPQQLALAGAAESIHDFGKLWLVENNHLTPAAAKTQYEGSPLQKLSYRMFNEGRALVDAGSLGARKLVIEADAASGSFQKRVE